MSTGSTAVLPSMAPEVQKFFAGGGAGMTAVFCTYPLDLARARMALLIEQGAKEVPSMFGTVRDVWREAGIRALYSGAGVSMTGAAIYCGLKFATYDGCKDWCRRYLLPDPDGPPSALHRALSGGVAGVLAQTFVYPFDVLRRRLQTGGAAMKEKYPGSIRGLWTLYKEEGVVRGLYRGCALNYVKTVPNTTVYLALFDILKDTFCTA
ncbi:mcfP [Symbiodinium natans]|uniref:McfP protein n=1 Tax=Symbiodinium natans TaxID=878477 RepID=A0A812RVS8_9DINO|nr:mcfP [Symbiodinium natans]